VQKRQTNTSRRAISKATTIKLLSIGLVIALLTGCYQKTDLFKPREITGQVTFAEATEISGAVASRAHPGLLWVHNDSGDTARLFALDATGAHLGVFHLEGISAFDWEDITIGEDPTSGEEVIYIGDIGDNPGTRKSVTVHRVTDPWVTAIDGVIPANVISSTTFTYPDQPRDAEALLLDPWSNTLYVMSKRESRQVLYQVPENILPGIVGVAEKLLVLPTPPLGSVRDNIVAADISPNGYEVMVKTYLQMLYWEREDGQSLIELLAQEPMSAPYSVEKQGEAVAWDAEGHGYFSIPEGSNPTISYYGKK
jgi:hypothetical protein